MRNTPPQTQGLGRMLRTLKFSHLKKSVEDIVSHPFCNRIIVGQGIDPGEGKIWLFAIDDHKLLEVVQENIGLTEWSHASVAVEHL